MRFSPSSPRTLMGFLFVACALLVAVPASAGSSPPDRSSVQGRLAAMAVPFVANDGQIDSRVAFYAPTFAGTVFVTRDGRIVYALPQGPKSPDGSASSWSLTESFVGGSAQPRGTDQGVTRVSSFVGDDPRAWKSDLPTYEVVGLGEVWEGVAVSLRAYGDNVEKLFTVAAGASERRIRVKLGGARRLEAGEDGSLIATTGLGEVAFRAPFAYQERGGRRFPIPVAYAIRGSEYGFRLGAHDRNLPVVIDPFLQSTYLGGNDQEGTNLDTAVTTMSIHPTSGDVYAAGTTQSLNFPGTTGGAFPTLNPNTAGGRDAFVARLNASLTTLIQATYLGGSSAEVALAVLVHPVSGEVYVAGNTTSADFPQTTGGASPTPASGNTGFVARLNAGLTAVLQSTYAGGSGSHVAALDVRANGEVYAAGEVLSGSRSGNDGRRATHRTGQRRCLRAALQPEPDLAAAVHLPGREQPGWYGRNRQQRPIADPGGIFVHPTSAEVYVVGSTSSTNLLATAGGAQPTNSGQNAFISRLNGDLTSIVQATYLGGGAETGSDIALHVTTGDVYVTGQSFSMAIPNTTGGAQATSSPVTPDAYIARLNGALTSNPQSTYFGGGGTDRGTTVLVHPTTGEVYAGGRTSTSSSGLPASAGGAQPSNGGPPGSSDGYIVRANAALTAFLQSTYFGGSGIDAGVGDVEIHPTSGEAYASGEVSSASIPATAGGAQPTYGGSGDSFVTRVTADLALAGGVTPTITQTPTQTPTITQTPPLTPGGPTNTPTPTLPPTLTPTLSPTIIGGGPGGPTTPIPTLAPWTMALLALALAGIGYLVLRAKS